MPLSSRLFLLIFLTLPGCRGTLFGGPTNDVHHILQIDDRRARGQGDLEFLSKAITRKDLTVQRLALRTLGRVERPEIVRLIEPAMDSPDPSVRRSAVEAMAQSYFGQAGDSIAPTLLQYLDTETDDDVSGALAASLGALRFEDVNLLQTVTTRLLTIADQQPATSQAVLGAVRGIESATRQHRRALTDHSSLRETLTTLLRFRETGADLVHANRIRRLSMASIANLRRIQSVVLQSALTDADLEVRRLAATAIPSLDGDLPVEGLRLVNMALTDEAFEVRLAVLRAVRSLGISRAAGCRIWLNHTKDPSTPVLLQAIDLLGDNCAEFTWVTETLATIAERLSAVEEDEWHLPAHAIVALAKSAPRAVTLQHLSAFANHPVWWVRRYAADAALSLDHRPVLLQLAGDTHPNVQEVAMRGIALHAGSETDSVLISGLTSFDPQLLRTIARSFERPADTTATIEALLASLDRISALGFETSFDAKEALLDRAIQLGNAAHVDRIRPYVNDIDIRVSTTAAKAVGEWTGQDVRPAPSTSAPMPFPTVAELMRLDTTIYEVEMSNGNRFSVRLFPSDAPTNAARFARLAEGGYFNSLTFHRVIPGFIVQGGSPGANEYAGDGPYSRDEITTRSHLRGTIGLSTRGRDTGDGQIFINLVDNVRLDYAYTIFGQVVEGMENIDRFLEGATISTITVKGPT